MELAGQGRELTIIYCALGPRQTGSDFALGDDNYDGIGAFSLPITAPALLKSGLVFLACLALALASNARWVGGKGAASENPAAEGLLVAVPPGAPPPPAASSTSALLHRATRREATALQRWAADVGTAGPGAHEALASAGGPQPHVPLQPPLLVDLSELEAGAGPVPVQPGVGGARRQPLGARNSLLAAAPAPTAGGHATVYPAIWSRRGGGGSISGGGRVVVGGPNGSFGPGAAPLPVALKLLDLGKHSGSVRLLSEVIDGVCGPSNQVPARFLGAMRSIAQQHASSLEIPPRCGPRVFRRGAASAPPW